jgi:ABC-type sugar transport system ATPase subunit
VLVTPAKLPAGKPVELGVRPDAIAIAASGLAARIVLIERLGGSSLLHARVEGLEPLLTVELPGTYEGATGTEVKLRIDPAHIHVFDGEGRAL